MPPPPILNGQMVPAPSSGASIWPIRVIRLPPERIWNGMVSTRLAAFQLSLNSAWSNAKATVFLVGVADRTGLDDDAA